MSSNEGGGAKVISLAAYKARMAGLREAEEPSVDLRYWTSFDEMEQALGHIQTEHGRAVCILDADDPTRGTALTADAAEDLAVLLVRVAFSLRVAEMRDAQNGGSCA